MRIRYIKDYKGRAKGDVVEVSRNIAFGLIDKGVAMVSKEMLAKDMKVKNGRPRR